jgi:soluble lytic murein transglycosylase-like protein
MRLRPAGLLLVLALLAGCSSSAAAPRTTPRAGPGASSGSPSPEPTVEPTETPTVEPTTAPAPVLPGPDEHVPLGRDALARALQETFAANREAIGRWLSEGDPATWPPPDDVVLLTLYEQRIYRTLASHHRLAPAVLRRLQGRAAWEAAANVAAGRALYEHFAPVDRAPDFRIRHPEPALALLGHFREGERRFGVDWEVLAAIMLVETRMGRIGSSSSAGALGPMQFLPATWETYGLGGDVRDPHDAVLGAANFLRAHGARDDLRAALYAYNPVNAYVFAVRQYARTMTRFPDAYYAYYDWQVFVRTVDGDVRLSGPGL